MTGPRLPILLILVLLGASATAAPLFRAPLPIDLGWGWDSTASGPLVTADFNSDGFPDLAYPHNDGRLVIALSQAGGAFAASKVSPVAASIRAMVAADVNADADVDLVTRRGYDVGVLLGNGDGTFTAGSAIATGSASGPMAAGDVNGDGKLDIVTAAADGWGGQSPAISIHLGNGSGGFAAAITTSPSNSFIHQLALADLNADGRADVIVNGSSYLRVYRSSANATLQEVWSGSSNSFALGHVNADATLDVVVQLLFASRGEVLIGQGNGTFEANGTQLAIADGTPFSFSDFDGDNVQDLVNVSEGITVARGLGNGTFADPLITLAGVSGQFVTGDFDRDGKRDAVTMMAYIARLDLVRGNGDGTFRDDRGYRTGVASGGLAMEVSSLDMNGDLEPDATTLLVDPDGTTTISVLRNDGSGGLLAPLLTPTTLTGSVNELMVGMLDGNHSPDAVAITTDPAGVVTATSFLGNGNATFTSASSIILTTSTASGLRANLIDVTGDGAVDLLVNRDIYEGNGNGSFDAARATAVTFDVVGDIDGNGTIDAIWLDSSAQRLARASNNGGGIFSAPIHFGAFESPGVLGDFTGDGIVDLFCRTGKATRVHPGAGNGTFGAVIEMAVGSHSNAFPVAADFNRDGDLDVLLGVEILLGNGDGRFRSMEYGSGTSYQAAVADFNGDGRPDVLSMSPTRNVIGVHLVGLVAEPVRSSTTTLSVPTPPQHAQEASYLAVASGTVVPVDGAVLYDIGGIPVGLAYPNQTTRELPVTASAAVTQLTLPVGSYSMTATYLGSEFWLPSSGSTSVTVERATTSLAIIGGRSGTYGTPLTLHWTLTAPRVEGMAQPTTTAFTLTRTGVALADVQWLDGSFIVRGLAAGMHTLKLTFTGDDHYQTSNVTFEVTISKPFPKILFETVPQRPLAGSLTLAAKFNDPGYGSITGQMTFSIGGSIVGTSPLVNRRAETNATLQAGEHIVLVEYSGDTNHEPVAQQVKMWVYTPPGTLPAVIATRQSFSSVRLRWLPSVDASYYKVYRRTLYANSWVLAGSYFSYEISLSAQSGKTWMYAVAPVYANETIGPMGPPDIATLVLFEDPIFPGTPIREAQVGELRGAVNAVRAFAGLAAFSFTDSPVSGNIRALHLTELRTALTQARNAIGMPMTFGTAPATGTPIRATHVEELRAGVR